MAATTGAQKKVLRFPRKDSDFKTVLSIDGGGLRGLIPAALLEGVEDAIKAVALERGLEGLDTEGKWVKPDAADSFDVVLGDYFDVCAGTSTGSIVASYVASKGSQAGKLEELDNNRAGAASAAAVKATVGPNATDTVPDFPKIEADAIANKAPLPVSGSAAAAQALFLAQALSIFPRRKSPFILGEAFNRVHDFFTAKYKAHYEDKDGNPQGVEVVLRNAFGDGKKMTDDKVLHSSLVVTAYQIEYDRPFVFFYSAIDEEYGYKRKHSGYAALRRSMTQEEIKLAIKGGAKMEDKGLSDIVMVANRDFYLWQAIRASTSAPTFFPVAEVENLSYKGSKTDAEAKYRMTDGGVVANNPAMAAVAFASGRYRTKFVGDAGKPSLAVLSIGCGTSSQLSKVKLGDGQLGWVSGPLVNILQGGAGELSAALNQHVANDWPGQTDRQFFRLQVTAGRDSIEDNSDETLAYSGEEVVLTKDSQKDPHTKPFWRALELASPRLEPNKHLSCNKILGNMDVVDDKYALLGIGHAMAQDPDVRDKLQYWVGTFILSNANKPLRG